MPTNTPNTIDEAVLEYIETTNSLVERQKAQLDQLRKQAEESKALADKFSSLLQKERARNAELAKKASTADNEQESAPTSMGWGRGANKGTVDPKMKASERILLERFGGTR